MHTSHIDLDLPFFSCGIKQNKLGIYHLTWDRIKDTGVSEAQGLTLRDEIKCYNLRMTNLYGFKPKQVNGCTFQAIGFRLI